MSDLARPAIGSRRSRAVNEAGVMLLVEDKLSDMSDVDDPVNNGTNSSSEEEIEEKLSFNEFVLECCTNEPSHHYNTRSRKVQSASETPPNDTDRGIVNVARDSQSRSDSIRKASPRRTIRHHHETFKGSIDYLSYLLYPPFQLAFFVLCVCGLILICYWLRSKPEEATLDSKFKMLFEEDLAPLRSNFRNIDNKVWNMLKASMRHSFVEQSAQRPAILALIGSKGSINSIDNFAIALARTVSARFPPSKSKAASNFGIFDSALHSNDVGEEAQKALGKFFEDKFRSEDYKVALLRRVDLLPGISPLALHSYCDDSNAPFTKALIILTLVCADKNFERFSSTGSLTDECLREQWSKNPGMNVDKIGALISRLGSYAYALNRTL